MRLNKDKLIFCVTNCAPFIFMFILTMWLHSIETRAFESGILLIVAVYYLYKALKYFDNGILLIISWILSIGIIIYY